MANVPPRGTFSYGPYEAVGEPSASAHPSTIAPAATFRGVARGRRGAMSGRGTPFGKTFGNRSAVFNTASQTSSVPDNEGPAPMPVSITPMEQGHASSLHEIPSAASSSSGGVRFRPPPESEEDRKMRFENLPAQNRFFEMRAQREALRTQYIRDGVLPDPDKPTDLAEAIALKGSCMDMCPEFEREEREFQNEGDTLEMFPGTNRLDPRLAVKIYRRPAAGRELPLPEDVRPPEVLCQTLNYLVHDLLPADPSSSRFTAVQPFMWNRTRAIRQDYIVQGERGVLAIECHERIARYHILCLHWRGGAGAEGWSEQQELEQLRKTIRSLTEFYQDARRKEGRSSPNEAEFRAYNLLLHIHDPETLREVDSLDLADAPIIRAALKLRGYAQRSNNVIRRGRPLNTEATMNLWTRFFGELKRNKHVTYLLACLAENAFSSVRAGALKAMSKTYLSQHAPLSLEFLQRNLGMDTAEQAREFAVELGAVEAHSQSGQLLGVRLGKINDDKPLPLAPFSATIVEAKRGSFSSQDVVDGQASHAAPLFHHASLKKRTVATLPTPPQAAFARPKSETIVLASNPSFPSIATNSAFGVRTEAIPQAPSAAPVPAPAVPHPASSAFSFASAKPAKIVQDTVATSTMSPFAKAFVPPTPAQPAVFSNAAPSEAKPRPMMNEEPAKSSLIVPKPPSPAPIPVKSPFTFGTATPSAESPKASPKPIVTSPPKVAEASKPKSPPKSPPLPKRTAASVTQGLVSHVIDEVVRRKVFSISEQAYLRQARIRQIDARDRTIERCTHHLVDEMWAEVLGEIVLQTASEAVADQARTRTLLRRAWRTWRVSLASVRQQAQQTARLLAIRSKVGDRSGGHRVSKGASLKGQAMEVDAVDDGSLRQSLVHAQEDRSDIWRPSTFLWAIVQHASSALLSNMDYWTVGLSTASGSAPSSLWLKVKFGIDRAPHAEVALRSDLSIHAMDIARASGEPERNLGLLVFELDPRLASKEVDWSDERRRLVKIESDAITRQSRYRPKLLLISWTGESRREIVTQLGLKATDAMRYNWSEVEVWEAGMEKHEDLQARFEDHLDALLKIPAKVKLNAVIGFEDVFNVCTVLWRRSIERLGACVERLSIADVRSGTALGFVSLAFNTATFLANRVIDDVVAVSELVADENVDGEMAALPLPSAETISEDVRSRLYNAAASQIDLLLSERISTTGSDILLLKVWLSESRSRPGAFPWLDYFLRLLHIGLLPVHQSWIESTLPTLQDLAQQVEPSSQMFLQAAEEIEYKAKSLLQKRTRTDLINVDEPVQQQQPERKIRRTTAAPRASDLSALPAPPIVKEPENSSISALRSVMAQARGLLSGHGKDQG